MTTDELRDRLAVLCGWRRFTHPIQGELWSPGLNSSKVVTHPFPPGDYNALIAAWPEEWWWVRCCCDGNVDEWRAGKNGGFAIVCIPDNGDEYADRLRLTIAVLEANP